jgi:hypothetical protein
MHKTKEEKDEPGVREASQGLKTFRKKKREKKRQRGGKNVTGGGERNESRNFEGRRPPCTRLHITYIGIYRQISDID